MAFTTPKTWTASVVTVADLNTHIRDNLNYLKTAIDTNIVQTDTFNGPVNNFALTPGVRVLYCTNTVTRTYGGFTAGIDGQRLLIVSLGAGVVELQHQATTSTAANRLINWVTAGVTPLAPGAGVAELEYDGTTARWRLIHHEQGAWLSLGPIASYTASAGTWTVDWPGDVITAAYRIRGREMTYSWYLNTTSTSAGMGTDLRIGIPSGYTSLKDVSVPTQTGDNNVSAIGLALVAAAGAQIVLRLVNTAAWTSSVTNLTYVRGQITFELT